MLCDCSLQILNNFIFEFVFCRWSPSGQWSTCWGLGAWLLWPPHLPTMGSLLYAPHPTKPQALSVPATIATLHLGVNPVGAFPGLEYKEGHGWAPGHSCWRFHSMFSGQLVGGGVPLTHPWSSNNCAPAWRWQFAIWVTHLPWGWGCGSLEWEIIWWVKVSSLLF